MSNDSLARSGWGGIVSVAKGPFVSQGVLVGDDLHLFRHHGVLHGELADQGQVPKSLLKGLLTFLMQLSKRTELSM
jgi:hypothetical protein